jgi:hypothetical protein
MHSLRSQNADGCDVKAASAALLSTKDNMKSNEKNRVVPSYEKAARGRTSVLCWEELTCFVVPFCLTWRRLCCNQQSVQQNWVHDDSITLCLGNDVTPTFNHNRVVIIIIIPSKTSLYVTLYSESATFWNRVLSEMFYKECGFMDCDPV